MATGITVQSGPIKTFISLKKDTSEYLYDQQTNVWVQRDDVVDKKLERNVQVRYRITTLKYINNEFSVVGTIDEDYLGAYNKRTYYTMMRDWVSSDQARNSDRQTDRRLGRQLALVLRPEIALVRIWVAHTHWLILCQAEWLINN